MNEAKSQTAEAKGSEKKGERDLWAGLWSLDGAQKVLGAACGAVLIGVLFDRDLAWSGVFRTWHGALAFAGAVGGLALIVLRALHVRVLPKAYEARAMMILALLPAGGLVIQALQNPWRFVMFAGVIGMAYAGLRLAGLLGDDEDPE